jgi:hypothetical protein
MNQGTVCRLVKCVGRLQAAGGWVDLGGSTMKRALICGAAAMWLLTGCGSDSQTPDTGTTVLPPSGAGAPATNMLPVQSAGNAANPPANTGGGGDAAPPSNSGAVNPPPANGGPGPGPGPGPGMMVPPNPGTGGQTMMGTAGMAGTDSMPPPVGAAAPKIPEMAGECPMFRNGTISYMGVSGIEVVTGSKPAGPTAPMVFYWHGTGTFAGEYAFQAAAVHQGVVSEGGVLVSFQNTAGGDFLSGTFIFGAADFELTDQFVACGVKNQNIDPRRIFATGCSAGGLFSTAMAAMRSNYMAAAAPNSGGSSGFVMFQGAYTPALMTIHGAPGVDVVGIDFSQSSATADKLFKDRKGFVINCNHGGVHCGGGSLSPDIWKFFKAHPYGVDPHPWTSLPAGFNSACKIY